MANVTQISLESLLIRYTKSPTSAPDTVALNAFFALINKERDGPALGVKVIASQLPIGTEQEVLSTLNVLDTCMSKCGVIFQGEVGKFRFLNEMIKLVSPKYLGQRTPLSVKQKVLQLLYVWTLDYPKEQKIKEAFDMLRKQGVIREIPNPNIPQEALGYESKKKASNSVFQDEEKSNILKKLLQSKDPEDIQAANWLIKSMVKEEEKLADMKSKTIVELEPIKNNIKLLNEMIESYKECDTTRNELDLMNELHGNLVRYKPTLKNLTCSQDNLPIDVIEPVLKTMDEVTECLNKYSEVILKIKSNKSNLASLLELDQQAVGSTSLIQMDSKNDPTSPNTSSLDVLCDVFSNLDDPTESSDILLPVQAISKSQNDSRQEDKQQKMKALEDLDVLSEHLLKENLPSSNYRHHDKIPLNLLTKINEIKKSQPPPAPAKPCPRLETTCFLESNSSTGSSVTSSSDTIDSNDIPDDCLVDITLDKKDGDGDACADEKKIEIGRQGTCHIKLKDIDIRLEDIKPSSRKSVVALEDKNGLSVLLHKALGNPQPLVTVYVVTTISKNELPLSGYLFQAVVPQGCKHRLLQPSATALPPFNPFLPPSAITQILLIANPENKENILLKFILSYVMDDDMVTEMGEVKELPLDVASNP
ncbi:ADP-ribosylation factor-binding protein GGA3 [Anthonomus grandis grandis]|uniref:ADP-ribosylation factor-binding protein GGA3 n=1 Tax=Anthonomus grandis grandis TaxID=2921223 RepID=UPI0021660D56|nr:ADP-ribosylation factor-binding protein GGA3 [Anthonomus grandis grandis]